MTDPRPRQPRRLRGLVGWIVVIPAASVVLALLGGYALIFGVVLAFCAVGLIRYRLGSTERGFLWQMLALVSAMAVAGPSPFLGQAYVALRGERVDATVVEEISVDTHRIADPATNEDLGILSGFRFEPGSSSGEFVTRFYNVGDTVPVLVARGPGLGPLPVERTGFPTNVAKIWLFGWLLGLGLTVVSAVWKGRGEQVGSAAG